MLGPSGSGNGALDTNGTLEVRGGTLVATGSSSMVETIGGRGILFFILQTVCFFLGSLCE